MRKRRSRIADEIAQDYRKAKRYEQMIKAQRERKEKEQKKIEKGGN